MVGFSSYDKDTMTCFWIVRQINFGWFFEWSTHFITAYVSLKQQNTSKNFLDKGSRGLVPLQGVRGLVVNATRLLLAPATRDGVPREFLNVKLIHQAQHFRFYHGFFCGVDFQAFVNIQNI